MSILGQLTTGARFAGTAGRMGLDAISSPLSFRPEKVTNLEHFNTLFRDYGTYQNQIDVTSIQTLDIKSVSSNCNNVVVSLSEARDQLPETLFIKLPCPEKLTRYFCNAIGVWEIECLFYKNVAPHMPIRVPKPYVVAHEGSRFVLVLEDLHADPSVGLFTNPDMIAGPDLETVRGCLEAFAKFHGAFHGLSPTEREQLLPHRTHPFTSPLMSNLSRNINNASVGPCHKKSPEVFTRQHAALYRRAMARWEDLLAFWFDEPLTLIHGDSHLGNFFVDGDKMGMLDFQAAQWGKGIRDVQYFLIDSLPANILAENEEALVRHYVDALKQEGVTLPFDDAWAQYRAYSFQTLMTIVVSLGLGTLTEKDSVMEELLARAVAAVDRVDFEGWLNEL